MQKSPIMNRRLEKVEEAMRSFMAFNGRRPCPADGSSVPGMATFGAEAGSAGACAGAPLGPDAGTGYVVGGTIPTRALGLDDSYAFDDWGRRFTYVVDVRATSPGTCGTLEAEISGQALAGGGVTIESATGGTVLDHVMYAYISHGTSGFGAFPSQGAASPAGRINTGSTDSDMQTNAGVDSSFNYTTTNFTNVKIQKSPVLSNMPSGGGDTGFDDMVWYRPDLKNTCCYGASSTAPFDFIIQTQFSSGGNQIFAFKKTCGSYQPITPIPAPFNGGLIGGVGAAQIAISPGDTYIVLGGRTNGSLAIFKLSGNSYSYLTNLSSYDGNDGYAAPQQFSPDGNYLLAYSPGMNSMLLFQRSSDTFTPLSNVGFPPIGGGYVSASYSTNGNLIFVQDGVENGNIYDTKLTVYQNNGATVTYLNSLIDLNYHSSTNAYVVGAPQNITGVTLANPGVVTVPSHGLSNGQLIYINSVNGMTQLNTGAFQVANVTTNSFTLLNLDNSVVDTTGYSAYSSGGNIYPLTVISTTGAGVWSVSPDGGLIITEPPCCPGYPQLFRLTSNGSGNPLTITVASPNPLSVLGEQDLDSTIWLSNTQFLMFSYNGATYSMGTVNADNTITWTQQNASNGSSLQPWDSFALSPDHSTLVVSSAYNGTNIAIFSVTSSSLTFVQAITSVPGGFNPWDSWGLAYRN